MDILFAPEVLWFFVGLFTQKILSALFGYGRVALFAQDVILYSLRLLISLTEDVAYIRQLKYLQMKKGGATDEAVDLTKEIDERTFDNWKETIIHKFHTSYPRQMRGLVKFQTWEEALTVLTKELKKRRS
jgi:hypothetical protein